MIIREEMGINGVPDPLISDASNSDVITREYLDSLLLEYRHIGAKKPDLSFELFGERFDTPISLGAMAAMVPFLHEGGMKEMAEGVKAAGGLFWSGYVSDEEFENALSTGIKGIRIIKPTRDISRVLSDIKHDEECGALAFSMDLDHGFDDYGEFYPAVPGGYDELSPKTYDEIKLFVESTSMPFIAAGILSVHDAKLCVEAGAKGLLITHHKGELYYAVPPLVLLPEIRKAVGDDIKIFVDCGITSGMDAFKALALGADGVCVARPFIKPFKENGAKGVEEKLTKMTRELAGVMSKTCSNDLSTIDPSVLHRKDW